MGDFRFSPRPNRAAEIAWQAWGPDAFARARRERKPILLSISAVWCHWCHVMDETTYSDDAVIAAIRDRFVAVRVDNDERPDVNARYNMGGWPTTAFLADDGTTLTGATYLPPEQMRRVLDELSGWYAAHRDEIAQRANGVTPPSAHAHATREQTALDATIPARIIASIATTFDDAFAGFGDAPKFPQPELLETFLAESLATGDERLRVMVVRTLLAMAHGGMYDHIEGGFFRYSTTRDWLVPHFEKMTEDHAGLIRVLALLLQRQQHPELHATLRSATAYVTTTLLDAATALFAGSQDADEAYYELGLEERRAHGAPYVDRTVYADRNAAIAGALCLAGAALEDEAVIATATRALDTLHEELCDDEGLLYHVRRPGGTPSVRGLLGDQSAYLRALLDAHEVTGEERFLNRAEEIAERLIVHFSAEDGGFYDHAAIEPSVGRLSLRDRPIVENALIAESFLRLADLCAQQRFRELAERALLAYAQSHVHAGSFAATYARAVRAFASPALSMRIVATPSDGALFREAARRLPSPFVAVRSIAPNRAATLDLPADAPVAYLCTAGTCGAPVRAAAALREAYDAIVR